MEFAGWDDGNSPEAKPSIKNRPGAGKANRMMVGVEN